MKPRSPRIALFVGCMPKKPSILATPSGRNQSIVSSYCRNSGRWAPMTSLIASTSFSSGIRYNYLQNGLNWESNDFPKAFVLLVGGSMTPHLFLGSPPPRPGPKNRHGQSPSGPKPTSSARREFGASIVSAVSAVLERPALSG